MERFYGAIPSKKDDRDYTISMFTPIKTSFADNYRIPEKTIGIYDQLSTGMCVAFSLATIKELQETKERNMSVRYSPAFIYGNRANTDWQEEGMQAREALSKLTSDGVCDFNSLPLIDSFIACRNAITQKNRENAKKQIVSSYVSLMSADAARTAILKLGAMLIISEIKQSFLNPVNGIIPTFDASEKSYGFHAMAIVGWETINNKIYYVVQNSWGKNWGDNGYCYIPTDYMGIIELWSIADFAPAVAERTVIMPEAMILSAKGNTFLPLRPIYEAINGEITVGRTDSKKLWVKTRIKLPNYDSATIYVEQGSTVMSVKNAVGKERFVEMPEPMLLTPKGNSFLPLRAIYEAVGGKITVGRTESKKLWVRTVVELETKRVTIYAEQGSNEMIIKEIQTL